MAPITTPLIPDWDNVITVSPTQSSIPIELPIAAWFAIAIGAYSLIIVLILVIRQCALAKGLCGECRFNCCQGSCGEWCLEACRASCDCRSPSMTGCLDALCPQRRNTNFADIAMCRCCPEQCDCCGGDACDGNCETINCLCCECTLNAAPAHQPTN